MKMHVFSYRMKMYAFGIKINAYFEMDNPNNYFRVHLKMLMKMFSKYAQNAV